MVDLPTFQGVDTDQSLGREAAYFARKENSDAQRRLSADGVISALAERRVADLRPDFENVMVAWDQSVRVARAVGDAVPVLQGAVTKCHGSAAVLGYDVALGNSASYPSQASGNRGWHPTGQSNSCRPIA